MQEPTAATWIFFK